MKSLYLHGLALTLTASLICCGKGPNVGTAAGANSPGENISSSDKVITEGRRYATECIKDKKNIGGLIFPAAQVIYEQKEQIFSQRYLMFTTSNCVNGGLSVLVQDQGTITPALDQAAESGAVELRYEKTTITLTNSISVGTFNEAMACGFNDWQLNVEKNLTGEKGECFANLAKYSRRTKVTIKDSTLSFSDRPYNFLKETL